MMEEKENIQKLTDEELDQVTGGSTKDNQRICLALLNNSALCNEILTSDYADFVAIRAGLRSGELGATQKQIIKGILSSKFGLDVTLDNRGCTKDANGNSMSVDTILNAINAYTG